LNGDEWWWSLIPTYSNILGGCHYVLMKWCDCINLSSRRRMKVHHLDHTYHPISALFLYHYITICYLIMNHDNYGISLGWSTGFFCQELA
jgi:hypothetical protein